MKQHNFYYKSVVKGVLANTGCSCGWLGDAFWSRHYARLMHRRHA